MMREIIELAALAREYDKTADKFEHMGMTAYAVECRDKARGLRFRANEIARQQRGEAA